MLLLHNETWNGSSVRTWTAMANGRTPRRARQRFLTVLLQALSVWTA